MNLYKDNTIIYLLYRKMSFEDPELIKKYIKEIQKFTTLDEYKQLKVLDKLQYQFALREIFPSFAEEHPFLFRKIVMGDDLTFLYKMLEKIEKINSGELNQKEVEIDLGKELANLYIYPALEAKPPTGNVQASTNPNVVSLPLSSLSNPEVLNH